VVTGDPVLTWETRDPGRVRDLLATLRFQTGSGGRMTAPGVAIVVVPSAGLDRLRLDLAGEGAAASEAGPAVPRLLAVGVATVDRGRRGATFPPPAAMLADDALLGARATATGDPRVLLLEPATEGRLAATLARHGEGPAALYLEVGPADHAAIRDRLLALGEHPRVGDGPFGPQLLASTRHPSGPHLLLVTRDPAPGRPPGDAWATIEP